MEKKLILDKLSGHAQKGVAGKLEIKVGDNVTKGQSILSIEAGKGNYSYKACQSGKVLKVLIEDGQELSIGDILFILECDESQADEVPAKAKSSYSFGFAKPRLEEISCDVLIIGGGPGGYVSAIRSAQLGLDTILIEKEELGGTCLNHGCIPTKTLIEGVKALDTVKSADKFGIDVGDISCNLEKLQQKKSVVVKQLVTGIEQLMDSKNIRVIKGNAEVMADKRIAVKDSKQDILIDPDKIIVATGSIPTKLNIPGGDHPSVITSKDALKLETPPRELVIIGGGVIGMEFAFVYNSLGSKVTVIEYADSILPTMDQDVVDEILASATEKGIRVITSACVTSIYDEKDNRAIVEYKAEDKKHYCLGDKVLMSVGRVANINSIDLSLLGVDVNVKGSGIKVDSNMKTSNDDIYAIGDVTNLMQLAHVASHQGMIAAESIAGNDTHGLDYDRIPSAVFTNPEIGVVGLTEKIAMERGIDYKVSKFPYQANGKALAMSKPMGFVKLIASDNMIVGGAIVGAHGTDMLAVITNLIVSEVSIDEALEVIYPHPTLSEGVHEGLLMLQNRGIHFG